MSTVNITIGPRTYPVVCADGEEAQIERLAKLIDEKYAQLGNARTSQEPQNLVFTALFLADELTEARKSGGSSSGDQDKPGGKKSELRAEIEELRAQIETLSADERAVRAENAELKAELEQAGQETLSIGGSNDGDDALNNALAETLETLAQRAEAAASALEASAQDA